MLSSAGTDRFRSSIELCFQTGLLLLLANGCAGLFASAQVDALSAAALCVAFGYRIAWLVRGSKYRFPRKPASVVAIGIVVLYPLDLYFLSGDFVGATLRLMLLFTALKIVISEGGRDYFYLGVLSFLHLLTASMFIAGPGFLFLLVAFVVLAIYCYATFEIRRAGMAPSRLALGPALKHRANLVRRLGTLSLLVSAGVLVISIGLFFVLPRTLNGARNSGLRGAYNVGFSDGVDLGLTGMLQNDFTPVMRIESLDGVPVGMQRWRGLALSLFDGVRWSRAPRDSTELFASAEGYRPGWKARPTNDSARRLQYSVTVEPLPVRAVFVAGIPELIRGKFPGLWKTPSESLLVSAGANFQGLRYEVSSWVTDRESLEPRRVSELFSPRFAELYLRLPKTLDPRIRDFARELTELETRSFDRARAIETRLKSEFDYSLELPAEASDDPLADFLFERKQGHCEYFASAMAVMLRTLGIPSRIVNGFAGGVYNPISGLQVVRSSDAHAWVEAYIPRYGWLEFDPTPANPNAMNNVWVSQAWMYWDALQTAWFEWVVDYDVDRQRRLAHGVSVRSQSAALSAILSFDGLFQWGRWYWDQLVGGEMARPSIEGGLPKPLVWLFAAIVLGFILRFVARWFLARPSAVARRDPSVVLYRRALSSLSRLGIERRASQSPEELAEQIRGPNLRPLVRDLTGVYRQARFGRDPNALARLRELVESLERLPTTETV